MKSTNAASASLKALVFATLALGASAFSAVPPSSSVYNTIQSSSALLDPITGDALSSPIVSSGNGKKSLVVILPQLGEFDSSEYCEFLIAAEKALEENNIDLQVVGIGDTTAAQNFCSFTGLSPKKLCIDPNGTLHKELNLHCGPNFSIPEGVSNEVIKFFLRQLPGGVPSDEDQIRPVGTAWLNYMAMCAGIGAPGTLQEILRGYFGDKSAPERFRDDDIVKAGFITIGPGTCQLP